MKSAIFLLDLVSLLGFGAAIFQLFRLTSGAVSREARIFLGLCLGLYAFIQTSNFIQFVGITDIFDPFEDYAETLFLPIFVSFIHTIRTDREAARKDLSIEAMTKALNDLAAEKGRLSVTLSSIADGVIAVDERGDVTLLNPAAEALTGWSASEAKGRPIQDVFRLAGDRGDVPPPDPVGRAISEGKPVALVDGMVLVARDGKKRSVADSASPIVIGDRIVGAVLVFRDVTEKLRHEENAARTQRLESIGHLAGGIAHDFNNILTGITGSLSMARRLLPEGDRMTRYLEGAERASFRARDLTRQLLTFSKGGAPIKRIIDAAGVVRESVEFALRGGKIRGQYRIDPDLWNIDADEGQLHQVFHNLVINAIEAMPDGGILRVDAGNATLPDGDDPSLPPGPYVRMTFADHGHGIRPEAMERIFDPYFSTKERGSGLGLATSYSIVRNHGGTIGVVSTLGVGTVFTIHLPASPGRNLERTEAAAVGVPLGGGRILLMDDETVLRDVVSEMLSHLGFSVIGVEDGVRAIAAYRSAFDKGFPFDAVVMDLTIPGGMGGAQAVKELLAFDPSAKVIVSSGYSNDPVMADHRSHGFRGMIVKPYKIDQLGAELAKLGL